MKSATVREAADLLTSLLELDRKAVSDLIRLRVRFTSEELAEHPTVHVGVEGDYIEGGPNVYTLGVVGLLNGLLGNGERLAIHVDEDFYENPEKLVERFEWYEDWPNRVVAE